MSVPSLSPPSVDCENWTLRDDLVDLGRVDSSIRTSMLAVENKQVLADVLDLDSVIERWTGKRQNACKNIISRYFGS